MLHVSLYLSCHVFILSHLVSACVCRPQCQTGISMATQVMVKRDKDMGHMLGELRLTTRVPEHSHATQKLEATES